MTFIDTRDEQPKNISDTPTELLRWLVFELAYSAKFSAWFHRVGNTDENVKAICQELRRRTPEIHGLYGHVLNRLAPMPCHCGRKGLYLVGRQTYCRQHVKEGQARLRRVSRTIHDARSADIEQSQKERGLRDLRMAKLRASRRAAKHAA